MRDRDLGEVRDADLARLAERFGARRAGELQAALGPFDAGSLAGGEVDDAELVEGVLALGDDGVPREDIHAPDPHVRVVGDELGPVGGVVDGGGDDPEVLRVLVGADVEEAVAVVDVVLVVGLAGEDEAGLGCGVVGVVGESGCGKSVMALSILGLLPRPPAYFAGGEILFNDQNLLDFKPDEMRRLRGNQISMIFQEPMSALNP